MNSNHPRHNLLPPIMQIAARFKNEVNIETTSNALRRTMRTRGWPTSSLPGRLSDLVLSGRDRRASAGVRQRGLYDPVASSNVLSWTVLAAE